jgi:hypothetical protein
MDSLLLCLDPDIAETVGEAVDAVVQLGFNPHGLLCCQLYFSLASLGTKAQRRSAAIQR